MSYRLRLLPAVSHPGHNFTGDSRDAVLFGSPRERAKRKRISLSFSRCRRTSYLPGWKSFALLIPNKSVRRQRVERLSVYPASS